ncbi:MAG: histidine kinase dimerization/phosphoacceptor domain -containing protein, partial [Jannaschia sp.]
MIADEPTDQVARQKAIMAFDLGGQVHAGRLDPLVELASAITGCPIAMVSIVHADEQRFEASSGVDIEGTGLESSICAHAILQKDILEIPDCSLDARTSDMPIVTHRDPPARFYAGAQIVTGDGVALGTLCVLDIRPRSLDAGQKRALRVLADQAMHVLELHRALRTADNLRREADHRVKNSLAGIAALARMSAARAESEETRAALQQVQLRIDASARLHAELYRQDAGESHIAIAEYLTGIVGHMRDMAPPGVTVSADFAPLSLPSGKAGALGLLITEMVGNAFKHGFSDGLASGRVDLRGTQAADGTYVVTCIDDGRGTGSAQ